MEDTWRKGRQVASMHVEWLTLVDSGANHGGGEETARPVEGASRVARPLEEARPAARPLEAVGQVARRFGGGGGWRVAFR